MAQTIYAPKKMDRNQIALMPFASIRELLALHRRVPTFRKRKCPAGIKPYKIRTPAQETAIEFTNYTVQLIYSPFALAFQVLPTTETDTRVAME